MYGLKTESSFDAAHFLTDYHGKCENLHGHRATIDPINGRAMIRCTLFPEFAS